MVVTLNITPLNVVVSQYPSGSCLRLIALLAVTSVLAPVLEEVVFRGFLLPSLTKVRWRRLTL